jgi:8-oxo-dGTP pyrophosphatase MutT (NUDIX family)
MEGKMAPELWKILSSTREKAYRVFTMRTDRARSPRTGEAYDFFVLESSDWVNVIPLTSDNRVVLIRQYRHGVRDITLEIPGGLMEEHDTPGAAASRELREETGYHEEELISLGWVHPNPAIQNNRCYTFVAKNVVPEESQKLDEKEDIEVALYPLREIPGLISGGTIRHSLVIAAFYRFYMEYLPPEA